MSGEKHRNRMVGKAIGGAIVILGVVASIIAIFTFVFGMGTLADFVGVQPTPTTSNGTSCSVEATPTDVVVTVSDPTSLAQGSSSADSEFVSDVSSALGTRGDLDRYASFINIYAGVPNSDSANSGFALQVASGARQALVSGNLTLSKAVFKTFFALGQPSNHIELEIYFYPHGCTPGS